MFLDKLINKVLYMIQYLLEEEEECIIFLSLHCGFKANSQPAPMQIPCVPLIPSARWSLRCPLLSTALTDVARSVSCFLGSPSPLSVAAASQMLPVTLKDAQAWRCHRYQASHADKQWLLLTALCWEDCFLHSQPPCSYLKGACIAAHCLPQL